MPFKESTKRSLVKTITFRLIVVCFDFLIISQFIDGTDKTIWLTLLSNLIRLFLYFFHERFWNRVKYGKNVNIEKLRHELDCCRVELAEAKKHTGWVNKKTPNRVFFLIPQQMIGLGRCHTGGSGIFDMYLLDWGTDVSVKTFLTDNQTQWSSVLPWYRNQVCCFAISELMHPFMQTWLTEANFISIMFLFSHNLV